jgi:hypothetical protein
MECEDIWKQGRSDHGRGPAAPGVAAKFARTEEMPIPVEEGVEVTTREAHTIEAVGNGKQMSVTDVASAFGITKSAAPRWCPGCATRAFSKKSRPRTATRNSSCR